MRIEGTSRGFGFTPIGKVRTKRIKWLIDEVLPAGALVFISAQAKAGKSTLALHAALCLTLKRRFLERFKCRKKTVLLYSLEDHPGETKAKAQFMRGGRRFPQKLFMSNATVVDLPKDFSRIEQDIVDSKSDVVILDTLRRSHGLNEDNSTDMAPILREFRRIVRDYGVTVVVVHHTGHKIEHPEIPGEWLRGTSDFNASWEMLIGLQKLATFTRLWVFHKYRGDFQVAYKTIMSDQMDDNTGGYPITGLVFHDSDQQQHVDDDQTVFLELSQRSLSGNQLEERLTLSRPRIDASLRRQEAQGRLHSIGHGRNLKWERVADDASTVTDRR